MKILETVRLILREIVETDDEFVLDLLNQPSFIKNIGDRKVRDLKQSRNFIETRFRQSYRENNFGLYAVERREDQIPIGICGFVKRDYLPVADIGFAFLPQFEKKGYAFESAAATMEVGRKKLNFNRVAAITKPENLSSIKLLEKLNFYFDKVIEIPPDGEKVNLFFADL